jgi:hypothetical protein
MNVKLRRRHRWLTLAVALAAGAVLVASLLARRTPPVDDGPALGSTGSVRATETPA